MAVLNVTTPADREFLDVHEAFAMRLAERARRVANYARLLAEAQAEQADLGAKARRELVRYRPALSGLLEPTLTNVRYVRDADGTITNLLTNEDAD